MPFENHIPSGEEPPLSANAKKLIDLIVRIIVNATFSEFKLKDNAEVIQKPLRVNGARTTNKLYLFHLQPFTE